MCPPFHGHVIWNKQLHTLHIRSYRLRFRPRVASPGQARNRGPPFARLFGPLVLCRLDDGPSWQPPDPLFVRLIYMSGIALTTLPYRHQSRDQDDVAIAVAVSRG